VVKPFELNVEDHDEVTITCCLPPAFSTTETARHHPPTIHVRTKSVKRKCESVTEHAAISLVYQKRLGLFSANDIERLNITPPAALEFVLALDADRELTCIACSHCHYPHLDLGDFARKPHRKHFCANCGRDSTWSKEPIVSTPLKPIYDEFSGNSSFERSSRSIDLAEHAGCDYSIWASTPAVMWKVSRPQPVGIRVQISKSGKVLVDDTFGEVVREGVQLERPDLLRRMLDRTVV